MSISRLQVNQIVNANENAVILGYGATVPSGQQLSANGNLNVVGVITATTFYGDGSGLTNLSTLFSSAALSRVLLQS